ncbi:hypothetical protein H8959_002360 [Pygathrix nigripes]
MAIPITVLDCDLLLYGRGHRTLDRFKLDDVSDEYLMSMYGFPRQFIYYLVELLGANLSRPTQRSRAISPETQILAALGFYTSGSFQTRMGDAIGISQASMSRCVANVTEALVERASHFIRFPADEASIQALKDEFYGLAGMPGVMGIVDCIHVAIKAPNAEDLSYVNRKGLHSLNCLMVCDIRGALMTVETNWPGSLQDCAVLQQSSLSSQFEAGLQDHVGERFTEIDDGAGTQWYANWYSRGYLSLKFLRGFASVWDISSARCSDSESGQENIILTLCCFSLLPFKPSLKIATCNICLIFNPLGQYTKTRRSKPTSAASPEYVISEFDWA